MKLIVHSEAEAELNEAASWYELQESGLGGEFRSAVHEALDGITGNTLTGSIAEGFEFESGIRRVSIRRFPYSIVYNDVAIPDTIYVLAILHQRRRPNYWLTRQDVL